MIDLSDILDGDEIQRELDAVLAAVANNPDLSGPGTDARSAQISRTMRARHLREARLLLRAGIKDFQDRGQKPPKCA